MIFARFMAIYGHKFKSCFETENEIRIAKREWALSLAPYSETQLVAAVDRCKETLAWMPTVSEFLAIIASQQAEDGVPALRDAYCEACRFADAPRQHQWSHPVVYHAGRMTGWFELRSQTERQIIGNFNYYYEQCVRRFRSGEQLDQVEPVMALEDRQDLTLFSDIDSWAEDNGIAQELACSLLYYTTKPRGSKARANFRAKSQEKLQQLGLSAQLPD